MLNLKINSATTSIFVASLILAACGGSGTSSNTTTADTTTTPITNPVVDPVNYTLSVSKSGTGSGTISSSSGIACGSTCSASVATGSSVTLTAVANTGSTFIGWAGGICSGTSTCTTTMTSAKSVTGEFALTPTGTSAINLSLVPARTSGVAPLSVFFDASATTDAGITTRPFHDLEYHWSFGDSSAGNWANGAQPGVNSKDVANGPLASHVFETPGTYTVTLAALDGTTNATTTTTITVQDPDVVFSGVNTICFSTSATYTDCPSGAAHVQTSNFATAVNSNMASNRRLLFRRGETFTSATAAVINANGPGIIGAYGSGTAKPIVQRTGSAVMIQPATYSTAVIGDWRIMDLDLDGQSVVSNTNIGIDASGEFNQLLVLRLNIHGTYRGVSGSHWVLSGGESVYDQWAVVDSSMTAIPGCNAPGSYVCDWRVYLAGKRSTIQGNLLDNQNTGGSHVIRSESMNKGIIANNTIARAGSFQHAIKLHAWAWAGGAGGNSTAGSYTQDVIIADNKIIGGVNPWTVSLGPQNESSDERVRSVIVERNWITAGSGTQIGIETSASDSTFRNNIFDLTGALYHTGISLSRRGIEPTPDSVRVYNNTFYSASSGDFNGLNIGTATNTTVRNNLGSAPSASGPALVSGAGTGLVQSNNLLNNSAAALFVTTTPSVPADFSLKSLPNPARDTGLSTVPVLSDFFHNNRPSNAVTDIGAAEGI